MLIPLVNDAMNDAMDRFSNIAKILLVLRSIFIIITINFLEKQRN